MQDKTPTFGRKVPLGIHCSLDILSRTGTPSLAIGIMILAMCVGLIVKMPGGFAIFSMALPWKWNYAGQATVTEIKQIGNFDGSTDAEISYEYSDPNGIEYKRSCLTAKKRSFFVVGNLYPILKFQDDWRLTVLADLDLWERYFLLKSYLQLGGLVGLLFFQGFAFRYLGFKISRWKEELLKHGTHTVGTFVRTDTAPIYWRIIGLKKEVFEYFDDSGNRHEASFVRKRKETESPQVDVFFDPFKSEYAFILQSIGETKVVRYSPETDSFAVSRFITVCSWFTKLLEYTFIIFVLYSIITVLLL